MKSKIVKTWSENFQPVTIEITFETLGELRLMYHRLNVPENYVNRYYSVSPSKPRFALDQTAVTTPAFKIVVEALQKVDKEL